MNDASETKRLAAAIDSLASVVAEIITERVRHSEEAAERKLRELPARAVDLVLTRKEVAERLHATDGEDLPTGV